MNSPGLPAPGSSADPISVPPGCSMAVWEGSGWKELCAAYKTQGKGPPDAYSPYLETKPISACVRIREASIHRQLRHPWVMSLCLLAHYACQKAAGVHSGEHKSVDTRLDPHTLCLY